MKGEDKINPIINKKVPKIIKILHETLLLTAMKKQPIAYETVIIVKPISTLLMFSF